MASGRGPPSTWPARFVPIRRAEGTVGRQIVMQGPAGSVHLAEVLADNEAQLQEQLKAHPELLPVEEFGLQGPLMVVGRETSLPSGAADLVGMTPNGDVVIVEFKTGPQNSDFRHTLAQLLDYGADMWQMSPETFETTVARRYFASDYCPPGAPTHDLKTVAEAAAATWPELSDEERASFTRRWSRSLDRGGFHYVIAAQRFTATMNRTIAYLNDQARAASFYAVELVRFTGGDFEAFEGRSVVIPNRSRTGTPNKTTDETELLDQFTDDEYQQAVGDLLEFARGQDLPLEWGSVGVSIRIRVPDVSEPLSIGWVFPPGVSGWLGLRDVSLGHDSWRAERDIGDPQLLESYIEAISAIPGAEEVTAGNLHAYHIPPTRFVEHYPHIIEAIADLVEGVGAHG